MELVCRRARERERTRKEGKESESEERRKWHRINTVSFERD